MAEIRSVAKAGLLEEAPLSGSGAPAPPPPVLGAAMPPSGKETSPKFSSNLRHHTESHLRNVEFRI